METSSKVDVLIVGAGPTGLTLAAALSKQGIRHRIIDRNLKRSDKSKALGIQAGTLEAIENFFGSSISKELCQQGFTAKTANLHFNGSTPLSISLAKIPSAYNSVLILEQSETERILEELLHSFKRQVDRGQTFISAASSAEGSLCEIRADDGTTEFILAKYLVGCDGAHSRVREWARIPFEGGTYAGSFILGDVSVSWPWEHGEIRAFVSDRGALACFPMKGAQKYRLVMIPLDEASKGPLTDSEISWEEFTEKAQYLCPDLIELSNPVWTTRFKVHHRMASKFKTGAVFIAGDAAHIHSPIGAQGMNTGIQDALNLASKLKNVIHQTARPSLLNEYERQRMPVARNILRSTHFVFKNGILSQSPFVRLLRRWILPAVLRSPTLQFLVSKAVSEVSIARKEISIREKESRLMNLSNKSSH